MPNVAVIGAGAIGLSIAWRLLQRGARVQVYERDAAGRGASWASAGLLAATAGHGGPAGTPLDALCRRGLGGWSSFAAELTQASGIDVALRTEGTLVVALDEGELESLRTAYERWRAAGDDAQRWLDRDEVARYEPALGGTVLGARFCSTDHQVDTRRLVVALVEAVRRGGGTIHEHAAATIETGGARPVVRTSTGDEAFDVVVLATGAWSADLAPLPVRPVKGQMLAVRDPADGPLLRHVVFTPEVYLVPRRDGRLLVGATSEERGFDVTVTDDGMRTLIDGAARTIPSLGSAPIAETWAGLRPAAPDDAPMLGWLTDRVAVATAHFRNGILLTPLTASVMVDLVLDDRLPAWAEPFSPARFG